jgi:hypothetical protein
MDDVLKYLQEAVGLTGIVKHVPDVVLKKFPLYLSHAYHYTLLNVEGRSFLFAEDNSSTPKTTSQLKKQSLAIFQHTELQVVFVLHNPSTQARRKLVQDRINFIVPDSQIYLPGLLISLKEVNNKAQLFPEQLTPSAQLLLLYHLQVEHLDDFSFKEIAEKLSYSAKTITKIATELKAKYLCKVSGTKEKRIVFDVERKELWKKAEPQMQSPVIKSCYANRKDNPAFCKSGDMALAHYTFLSDTGKEEYAVYKTIFEELNENNYWDYLDDVEGDIKMEVWKYNPFLLSDNGYIDPLSLYLCYREDTNERIQAEIIELINKKIW